MKYLLFAIMALSAAGTVSRADIPDPVTFHSAKTTVIFQHPNKFQDIRDMYLPTDKGEVGMLGMFAQEILNDSDDRLPDGYHLTITFTDVKYAGDFPPAGGVDETRIIRSIFPPHYKFDYQVTNASGQVVKQDHVDLLDMDFQLKMSRADERGPLRVDKDEINDWLRTNLSHLK